MVIEGEPNIKVDMSLTSDFGDSTHAGYIVAVTPVTNAIPMVCAAPAGVLTYLDLPPHGQRLILLLIEDPPVPYAEISARLGIPVGSIGPNRRRCLEKLRHYPAVAALISAEAQC